jgi:hypothetical protein
LELVVGLLNTTGREKAAEFANRICRSQSYESLVKAGIDGETLVKICVLLWAFERMKPEKVFADLVQQLAQRFNCSPPESKRRGGQPSWPIRIFQLCGDVLTDNNGGKRYSSQFYSLAGMVYDGEPATYRASDEDVKAYIRAMKRIRADAKRSSDPEAMRAFYYRAVNHLVLLKNVWVVEERPSVPTALSSANP